MTHNMETGMKRILCMITLTTLLAFSSPAFAQWGSEVVTLGDLPAGVLTTSSTITPSANSIDSTKIKEGGVGNGDLQINIVDSTKVRDGTLSWSDMPTTVTPFAKTIFDDAASSNVRSTLELGTMATQAASAVAITGGTGAFTTLSGIGLTLGLDGDDLTTGQYSGLVDTLTAGENLVFGDLVYMNVAGKMYKAQGDSVASANAEGYALGTISADAVGLFLRYGYIFNSAWTTVQTTGAAIYVSDTAAGVPTTVIPADVGDVVVPIGTCVGTDVMFFNPPGKGQYVVR